MINNVIFQQKKVGIIVGKLLIKLIQSFNQYLIQTIQYNLKHNFNMLKTWKMINFYFSGLIQSLIKFNMVKELNFVMILKEKMILNCLIILYH